MAFGTRSVVKLDGLDWLSGLVRRGVDGRDCVCALCFWYVVSRRTEQNRTAMYSKSTVLSLLTVASPPLAAAAAALSFQPLDVPGVELAPDCC